jgi:hypothetical protein
MKIREAAIIVLESEKRPMRCHEIARLIKERRLHPLPTANPTSVVNKAIRRHCFGVTTDGSRPEKHFKELSGRRYTLLTSTAKVAE